MCACVFSATQRRDPENGGATGNAEDADVGREAQVAIDAAQVAQASESIRLKEKAESDVCVCWIRSSGGFSFSWILMLPQK